MFGFTQRVTRLLATGATVAVVVGLTVIGAGSAAAAPSSRSVTVAPTACAPVLWGSTVEKNRPNRRSPAPVTNVRAASHRCYDRVVIDLGKGRVPGYRVKYVKHARYEGSGSKIPLKGGAALQITLGAPAYDVHSGEAIFDPAKPLKLVKTKGFHSVKQVAFGGSFEAQSTFGIGVRARLPFQVSLISGKGNNNHRLVIDIARSW